MRRLYSIAVLALLGLGTTSCGPKEEAPAGGADTAAPAAPPATDTAQPAAQDTAAPRPDTAAPGTAR